MDRVTYGEENLETFPDYFFITPSRAYGEGLVAGYTMAPHAQRWVDACGKATRATSFGTYIGHSPSVELAVDTFTPVPSDRRAPGTPGLQRVLGDDIADFSLETMRNGNPYGIDYVIWRQHIYNPEIAEYWRTMEDRGGVTNNHFDHVHTSFNKTAPVVIIPDPDPHLELGEIVSLSFRYAYDGLDWVFDGPSGLFFNTGTEEELLAPDKCGVVELGQRGKGFHDKYSGLARAKGWWRGEDEDD